MSTHMPVKHTGAEGPPRPEIPHDLHELLAEAEAARTRQLESLPHASQDPVTAAYRGSVARILEEIRTARRRLTLGLYGVCAACGKTIASERLKLLRWATSCTGCAERRHA
ncbi:MAG: TraR/DksA family transcriptional regulator [Nocardioidaceae bacterium]